MQFGKNSLMSSFFLMIENICETGVAIVELFLIGPSRLRFLGVCLVFMTLEVKVIEIKILEQE